MAPGRFIQALGCQIFYAAVFLSTNTIIDVCVFHVHFSSLFIITEKRKVELTQQTKSNQERK